MGAIWQPVVRASRASTAQLRQLLPGRIISLGIVPLAMYRIAPLTLLAATARRVPWAQIPTPRGVCVVLVSSAPAAYLRDATDLPTVHVPRALRPHVQNSRLLAAIV
jgi:hypothetical protein